MNANEPNYLEASTPDSVGSDVLSIALIGPDEQRRKESSHRAGRMPWGRGPRVFGLSAQPGRCATAAGAALRRHHHRSGQQPRIRPGTGGEHLRQRLGNGDGVFGEGRPGPAGPLHARGRSRVSHPALCSNTMAEALVRASARRPAPACRRKTGGRLLVFLGAKGGAGVTTLACNFAVSLAQESGQKHPADRSRSAPRRRRPQPRHRHRVLHRQRPAGFRPAGCGFSHQASGQAQLRRLGARGSRQVPPVPGHQRGHRQADHRGAPGLRQRRRRYGLTA